MFDRRAVRGWTNSYLLLCIGKVKMFYLLRACSLPVAARHFVSKSHVIFGKPTPRLFSRFGQRQLNGVCGGCWSVYKQSFSIKKKVLFNPFLNQFSRLFISTQSMSLPWKDNLHNFQANHLLSIIACSDENLA